MSASVDSTLMYIERLSFDISNPLILLGTTERICRGFLEMTSVMNIPSSNRKTHRLLSNNHLAVVPNVETIS